MTTTSRSDRIPTEDEVLQAAVAWVARTGQVPTGADLGRVLGVGRQVVNRRLTRLRQAGRWLHAPGTPGRPPPSPPAPTSARPRPAPDHPYRRRYRTSRRAHGTCATLEEWRRIAGPLLHGADYRPSPPPGPSRAGPLLLSEADQKISGNIPGKLATRSPMADEPQAERPDNQQAAEAPAPGVHQASHIPVEHSGAGHPALAPRGGGEAPSDEVLDAKAREVHEQLQAAPPAGAAAAPVAGDSTLGKLVTGLGMGPEDLEALRGLGLAGARLLVKIALSRLGVAL
jgi:biotin operon repressor